MSINYAMRFVVTMGVYEKITEPPKENYSIFYIIYEQQCFFL